MSPARRKRLLLVGGAGGMGRLLARFFRARGYDVVIDDPAGPPRGFRRAGAEDAATADVVVVAASLGAAAAAMERVLDAAPRGLVFDIASVKSPLVGAIARARAEGVAVASVHPMFGPDARTLRGRDLVVCDAGDPAAARRAERLFHGAGLRLVRMRLDAHDAAIAKTLGLAHLAGLVSASVLAEEPPAIGVPAATSYRLLDALARLVLAQPADLTFDIQRANPESAALAERLARTAAAVRDELAAGDAAALARRIEAARRALPAR